MLIDAENRYFTVIVTVDGSEPAIKSIIEHASQGLEIFKKFPGFKGGATHLNKSGTRVIQYLQWQDEASHFSCMGDPSWNENQSSKNFMELAKSGVIEVTVDTFKIVYAVNQENC